MSGTTSPVTLPSKTMPPSDQSESTSDPDDSTSPSSNLWACSSISPFTIPSFSRSRAVKQSSPSSKVPTGVGSPGSTGGGGLGFRTPESFSSRFKRFRSLTVLSRFDSSLKISFPSPLRFLNSSLRFLVAVSKACLSFCLEEVRSRSRLCFTVLISCLAEVISCFTVATSCFAALASFFAELVSDCIALIASISFLMASISSLTPFSGSTSCCMADSLLSNELARLIFF
mmetsp:Transcript_66654/g.145320  ORF Transcript_66654/g.145320 Transcript_66654/m.145320 type:complete len:229 (+) Transcript_66654:622-1308(+)